MFDLHIHLWTMGVPDTQGGQQKVLDLLRMELQMAVRCQVDAGNPV